MSFLLQKDVPLIVTILVAAWTWIVSEHIKQTNDLQLLEYAIGRDRITFQNISQAKSIKEIQILVSCSTEASCFEVKDGFAGTTEFAPPFGVRPSEPGTGNETDANYRFTLAVGATIVLVLHTRTTDPLRFTVVNSENFDRLKLMPASSWSALFYRNHGSIMVLGLALATVFVLVLVAWTGRRKGEPAPPAAPMRHDVNLWINGPRF